MTTHPIRLLCVLGICAVGFAPFPVLSANATGPASATNSTNSTASEDSGKVNEVIPSETPPDIQSEESGRSESSVSPNSNIPLESNPDESIIPEFIDSSHKTISENIIYISNLVDSFFSNERYLEESYGSYGCLKFNVYYSEGGHRDSRFRACLKIDLPHTKKKWKLIFESDDNGKEDVVDGQDDQRTVVAEVDDNRNTSSTALLRYVAKEELLKYISFDIGIKTRIPLDPFARLRYRRTWVPEPWLFRLTESLYYFNSIKGGFLSRFDIERRLGENWYARMTSEADFRDEESQFNLAQNFGVYRRVGKGRALGFELVIGGASQPNPHVEFYVYQIKYRINVWRDWFFFEVNPQLVHQRENDFDQVAGILFAVEAVFGNR